MNNEKKIVVYTSIAHFYTHFFELIFPALAIPLTLSFKMDLAEVLKISFLMYLLFGLGALPWGIISDRIGHKNTLIIFFIGAGIGAVLTALAGNPLSLFFALAIIGFFASSYHPAGLGMLSLGVKNRGQAMGVNGAAGSAGIATAPFLGGLFNWLIGWEMLYLAAGIISIILGILLFFSRIDETPVHSLDVSPEKTNDYIQVKILIALACVLMLSGLVYRMNTVILPAYLELRSPFLWDFFKTMAASQVAGIATLAATILATLIYTVGIFGQYYGGKISDRYSLSSVYLVFTALGIPALLAMALFTDYVLVAAASIYVFFALGMQPVENSLLAKLTPSRLRSTGYGIKFFLTFGVGSLAVYLAGWLKSGWGIEAVYFSSVFLIVLMSLGILYLVLKTRGSLRGQL